MKSRNNRTRFRFRIKQYLKMFVQKWLLPLVYRLYRNIPIQPRLVIFADAHHDRIPFSMERMRTEMDRQGFQVVECIADYNGTGIIRTITAMMSFMKYYARARYVFICDYFLPVASCRKKEETTVVQLWHSGGLLKKFGYDASEDIPPDYRLNPYENYDLVTVSAECCVPVFEKAMRKRKGIVQATGISRTDNYWDEVWIKNCRRRFEQEHPQAAGKKVVLWAPTFRGNASAPRLDGMDTVLGLQEKLGDDYIVLMKLHPYLEQKSGLSNSRMPTEQLLPFTDILITDYSSVLCDYLLFERPFVLYTPDYEAYEKNRGLYIDYSSLPGPVVKDGADLADAVKTALLHPRREGIAAAREYHMGRCDGHATERILERLLNEK